MVNEIFTANEDGITSEEQIGSIISEETLNKLNVDTDAEASIIVSTFYETYSKIWANNKKDIEDWDKMYRSIVVRKTIESLANTFVPESFAATETLSSLLIDGAFADEPFFVCKFVEPEQEKAAKRVEQLLDTQLDRIDFKNKVLTILRRCIIDGQSVVYVPWKYEEGLITKRKVDMVSQLDTYGKLVTTPVETIAEEVGVTSNSFDIERIDVVDALYDPTVSIKNLKNMLVIRSVSFEMLKQMERDGIVEDVDNLKNVSSKETGSEDSIKKEHLQTTRGFGNFDKKDVYVLHDFWGLIPRYIIDETATDEDELVPGRILTCNGHTIGKMKNPFQHGMLPFIIAKLIAPDDTGVGVSLVGINAPSQLELNDTHNQILDHKTLSLFHITLKGNNAGIKRKDMVIKPKAIWEVEGDVNQVKELRPDSAAFAQGVQVEAMVKQDLRHAFGATDSLQGINSGGRKTAFEVNVTASGSTLRTKTMSITFAETFFKPLLKMLFLLDRQYLTTDQRIYDFIGKESIVVTPDDLWNSFEFIPKVMSDAVNRVTQRQLMLQMIDLATKTGDVPLVKKLTKKVYLTLGFKDAEEMFEDESKLYPPDKENTLMLENGDYISAYEGQDHATHLQNHMPAYEKALAENNKNAALLDRHIYETFYFVKKQQGGSAPQINIGNDQQSNTLGSNVVNSMPIQQPGAMNMLGK